MLLPVGNVEEDATAALATIGAVAVDDDDVGMVELVVRELDGCCRAVGCCCCAPQSGTVGAAMVAVDSTSKWFL